MGLLNWDQYSGDGTVELGPVHFYDKLFLQLDIIQISLKKRCIGRNFQHLQIVILFAYGKVCSKGVFEFHHVDGIIIR